MGSPSEAPVAFTRDMARSRRGRTVRAHTESMTRLPKAVLELGRLLYPDEFDRPATRAECIAGPRPCPYVGCKFNLFLDVSRTGAIKFNFPDLEPHEMGESCCLDVADAGNHTLEEVGVIMNVTRERVRQVEVDALVKLEDSAMADFADSGLVAVRAHQGGET